MNFKYPTATMAGGHRGSSASDKGGKSGGSGGKDHRGYKDLDNDGEKHDETINRTLVNYGTPSAMELGDGSGVQQGSTAGGPGAVAGNVAESAVNASDSGNPLSGSAGGKPSGSSKAGTPLMAKLNLEGGGSRQ